jgi:ubiquinone/menaquinone biosynthesis C-methylase UbiE
MAEIGTRTPEYVLGHSTSEHERLIAQSDFIGDLTAEVFRRSGLDKGMRVLDVGSGAGDVAFLAGGVVGRAGSVLGVDRSAESTVRAQERARSMGLDHVTFRQSDLETLELDHQVDALVGRLILMYLPDRENVLRRLLTFVRPGGLVIFHEVQIDLARSVPPCPLFDTTVDRVGDTFARAGFETAMGSKLLPLFGRVGLQDPKAILGGRVEGEPGTGVHAWLAGVARNLLPAMERLGVATADDVQIETLAARLETETQARHAVIIPSPLVGCWARKT